MTEPNKELPKEVIDKIGSIRDSHIPAYSQGFHMGCQYTHNIYAPIIEAKDQIISEAGEYEKRYEDLENKLWLTVMGKDKRIAGLEAEVKKVVGLLKDYVIGQNLETILQRHQQGGFKTPLRDISEQLFKDYCKENGIDLGG